ncbi:hypothetical protein yfred0001_31360 [Yersinia frederiksenii ATCC 33641]|nr:hypothetical protein yfred0001_31360 [Yersinia frederiksenii ATCC 33641]
MITILYFKMRYFDFKCHYLIFCGLLYRIKQNQHYISQ